METWYVDIGFKLKSPIETEELFDTLERLESNGAVASTAHDMLSGNISLHAEAENASDAVSQIFDNVNSAFDDEYGMSIENIEVQTEELMDKELDDLKFPDVVNKTEASVMAGVTRQRLGQLSKRDDFPPVVKRSGREILYLRSDIAEWVRQRNMKTGRPKKK